MTDQAKEFFPNDYFRYDTSNYRKFFDLYMEDIRAGYSQQVRNSVAYIRRAPDMRIILCGMGGSAIAGMLMKSYLYDEKLSIENAEDYKILPEPRKTDLVILTSYSGNTEEILSSYRQARGIGCQLIIITSGGKLEENATQGRLPLVKLPRGYPPRAALNHMFFALLKVFEETGLIAPRKDDVSLLLDYLTKNSLKDFALNLSEKMHGKIPLIYSSNQFYPVAYRWKTQLNENAKTLAFSNLFPELTHNELEGFTHKNGLFHAVLITTDEDSHRLTKKMRLTKDLMQKAGIDMTELNVKGNRLVKMFSAILAGDLTSYYLALRYRIDPSPTNTIEKLKKDMGPFI